MLSELEIDLRSVMRFVDWIYVSKNSISCNIKTIWKVKDVQCYKLAELMGSQLHHNPNKIIHSFSSYQLSEIEKSLLCKGLNFALPPKQIKFEYYLLRFELIFRNIYNENQRNESFLHLKIRVKDVGLSSSDCIIKKTIASETSQKNINIKKKTITSSYEKLTKLIQLVYWTSHFTSKKNG